VLRLGLEKNPQLLRTILHGSAWLRFNRLPFRAARAGLRLARYVLDE